jgi:hypothetical protein
MTLTAPLDARRMTPLAWCALLVLVAVACAEVARPPAAATRERDAAAPVVDVVLLGGDAPPPPPLPCDRARCGHAGEPCYNEACEGLAECRDGFCVACPRPSDTVCSGRCTDIANDPSNCGRCGLVCHPLGCLTPQTACGRCPAGRADCDGDCRNACEADITGDACHCGGCAVDCNAYPWVTTARCDGCACVLTRCAAGHADCDLIPSTGCEADTRTERFNCGMCGHVCEEGQVCRDGACVRDDCVDAGCNTQCAAGLTRCGRACVDLEGHFFHCGSCGVRCATGERCTGGRCVRPACGASTG